MKKKLEEFEEYKPIQKSNIQIDGILLNTVVSKKKEKVASIAQKMLLTSYDPEFNTVTGNLIDALLGYSYRNQINNLLVKMRGDIVSIFLNFPVSVDVLIASTKDIKAGTVIYKNQILDITKVRFEDAIAYFDYEIGDKIIYIFRNGFNFGLYCNFTKIDSIDVVGEEIARIQRYVEYHNVYETVTNTNLYSKMIKDGWFPFIALIRYGKYEQINEYYKTKNPDSINSLKDFFNKEVLDNLVKRWLIFSIVKGKKEFIETSIDNYNMHNRKGYIASITILITQIEGLLRLKYSYLKKKSIQNLLHEIEKESTNKRLFNDSIVLPGHFIEYLNKSIYGNFDDTNIKNTRHTVAHGVSKTNQYTWKRALQIILTFDQLICYM
jgi:hypothetical protein